MQRAETPARGRRTLTPEERHMRKIERQKAYRDRKRAQLVGATAPAKETEGTAKKRARKPMSATARAALIERAAHARAARARYAEQRKKEERRAARAQKKNGKNGTNGHALVPVPPESAGEAQALAEGRAIQRIRIPLEPSGVPNFTQEFLDRHDATDAKIEIMGRLFAAFYRNL